MPVSFTSDKVADVTQTCGFNPWPFWSADYSERILDLQHPERMKDTILIEVNEMNYLIDRDSAFLLPEVF